MVGIGAPAGGRTRTGREAHQLPKLARLPISGTGAKVAATARLERATLGSRVSCSIQLSYVAVAKGQMGKPTGEAALQAPPSRPDPRVTPVAQVGSSRRTGPSV